MRHHGLVGMAATQIGKNQRIFVSEVRKNKLRKGRPLKDLDPLRVFINPKIISVSKRTVNGWEGCGSIAEANLFCMVQRPAEVVVEAFNTKGEKFRLKAKNLLARIIQHELDHLNGVVCTDRGDKNSYMSRNEYLKKFSKKS